jgi:hypothetical protein
MFRQMINKLRQGERPSPDLLFSLLKVALVKKQGVLQQPPLCWSNDSKINPDVGHLLWAAVMLGSQDEIITAAGLMVAEHLAKPGMNSAGGGGEIVTASLSELLDLAPTPEFRDELSQKVDRAKNIISPSEV